MRLLSLFKRQDDSSADAAAPDAVASARTRARRRLIGATVLLGIGVLGFPLLFETQPRPIPVDIPIEIPRKDTVPPLAMPPARAPVASAATAPAPRPSAPAVAAVLPAPAKASSPAVITERAAEAGRDVAAPAVRGAASAPTPPAVRLAAVPAARPSAPTAPRIASAATPKVAAPGADDGQRARALLEGKPLPAESRSAETTAARVVVQVGAYTDADKLREARQRVEKLGLKTYTQVIESDGGKRTRVRVGPFATREEADKAAARLKAAGLPAAILAL